MEYYDLKLMAKRYTVNITNEMTLQTLFSKLKNNDW